MIPDEFVAKIERGQVALIGQAPGPKGDPMTPLMGRVGRRLAFMMDVGFPEEYLELFARTNLLDSYPGARKGKGDLFSVDDASDPAEEILKLLEANGGGELILLGKNVAAAFGLKQLDWLTRFDISVGDHDQPPFFNIRVSIVPHPSGANHWWNDPKNQRAAKSHLRAAARRARKMADPQKSDSSLSGHVLARADLFDACGKVLDDLMVPVHHRECVRLAYEYLGIDPETVNWERQVEDFRETIADTEKRGKAGFGYVGEPHFTAHRPSWFPNHLQAEMNFDAVDIILTEAEWRASRLEAGQRSRWMRKHGRDPITVYENARDGYLREFAILTWFKWQWPDRVLDPDNKGQWHLPCDHDFKLKIDDELTLLVDVALDTGGGVVVKKEPVDLHILTKFDDDENPTKCWWTGVQTGVQFASGAPAAVARSPRRLVVWLNMLDKAMDYSAYLDRVAEGYKPGRKGSTSQRKRKLDPNQSSLLDDEEE